MTKLSNTSKFKGHSSNVNMLTWAAAGAGIFLTANAIYQELSKYKLKGKVVLITGGSRGLGLVLARQLAEKGALLAICARSADQLENARIELAEAGASILALPVDVTNKEEVKAMVRDTIAHYGRIDVLINNAGIVQVGPQDSMGVKEYEEAMNTNFYAPLYAMQAVIPHFTQQGEGRIVNITSIGGKIAIPHLLPYTASKFALVGLSEGMHTELKKHNIIVTTVVPNLMRTGSPRNITVRGNHKKEYAWFKLSDSSPVISQRAESAAHQIIKALEYGEAETILTLTAKAATIVKGIAPGWVAAMLSFTNWLLPDNVEGGNESKKGYEVESSLTRTLAASISDRAAFKNNEL